MFFSTIEEYEKELNDINIRLEDMENRMKKYPDRIWIKGNYNALKEIRDIIIKDRDDFLEMKDENINLHVQVDDLKNLNISASALSDILGNFNKLSSFTTDFLKNSYKYSFECHELIVDQIRDGSIQIVFRMDKDITDLREVFLNHQVFNKIIDLVSCGKEDLNNQKEIIGLDSLLAYKKFLKVFIDNDLDFTLENGSRKVSLTSKEALEIYKKIEDGI